MINKSSIFENDGTDRSNPFGIGGKTIGADETVKVRVKPEVPKKEKKKKHTKRISVKGEFMKTKYNDNIYGWLQYNSFADEIGKDEYRTLTPKYIIDDLEPWTIIYRDYAASGQRRKFRDEIKKYYKAGFIKDVIYIKDGKEVECYELTYEYGEWYYLISDRVLEYLVNTKSVHTIRTLCYLAFKFNKNTRYTFTQKELLTNVLGVKSATNKDTNKIIDDVLFDLEKSGFIGINHDKYTSLNNKATRVKQIRWVNMLPNDLKEYFERKR